MGFRPCAQGDLFSGIINTTRIQDKVDKELRYEPRDIQIASPQPTFLNFFDNFKVRQVVQVNKRRYQPIVENKEAPRTKNCRRVQHNSSFVIVTLTTSTLQFLRAKSMQETQVPSFIFPVS